MASDVSTAPLSSAAVRAWRARLLHGEWRIFDLEFFHVLSAVLSVASILLVTALVVATTKSDGTVKVSVLFLAALVAGLLFVRAAARAGLRTAERRTSIAAAHSARNELLDAVSRGASLRPGATSGFVSRSASAVGEYLAKAVPARAVALPIPVALLVLLAVIDPWSALIATVIAVGVPVVLVVLGRRAATEAEAGLGRLRSLSARALELLAGAVELRSLGALAQGRAELTAATERAVASTRRSLRLGLRSATALDVLAGAAVGLVAMTNGLRLLQGDLGLGHALAAVLLTAEVFVPLRAAGAAFHSAADGRAAILMLDAVCSAARPPRPEPTGRVPAVGRAPAVVTADDVDLVASNGSPVVVRGLHLDVPARGALVITGPTGSGKSTILRALCGQPLVVGGSLRLGNAEPSRLSQRLRGTLVALVDQRPFLVAGTVRDNLALGRADLLADDIDEVVARCGLAEVLAGTPLGLDQPVGEEGRLLSAGERTKVALARAVLRDPGVLLLDEVGAHLDDAALGSLRTSLSGFLAARTVIEVAHDRPLLVDAGSLDLAAVTAVP